MPDVHSRGARGVRTLDFRSPLTLEVDPSMSSLRFRQFLRRGSAQAMQVSVGPLTLPNPVMPGSGTYGSGAEFSPYADPALLGAVVVKSLSASPWSGHAGPNLCQQGVSMLNAVGLANPGVGRWAEAGLKDLLQAGARVVASLWGRSVDEFAETAGALAELEGPVAWEINLSCPNMEDPGEIIAHNAAATSAVVEAVRSIAPADVSVWAKLSPNAGGLVEIASAAAEAGASAVTLVNTLSGMVIDIEAGRPILANGYGGVSGPLLLPVAVRAVHQVRQALPGLAIVGSGGVSAGVDAVQLLMAGANAVQVGAANFADPRATHRVLYELQRWCQSHGKWPSEITSTVRRNVFAEPAFIR